MGGYVTFVDKVRNYSKSMSLTEAVDECVEDGVLEGFFNKHRRKVRNMGLNWLPRQRACKNF